MTFKDWNTFFQFGSAVLLGLTFVFGAAAIITDHILSKRQEARIASAQQDAENARNSAAQAAEGTAKALAEAATLNQRAARLELEAAQQQERAAKAETELLELKHRLAWRTFTPDQEKQFIAELSRFGGTRVAVTRLGDMEATSFARQIISILRAAQWELTENFGGIMSPPRYGVICTSPPRDRAAETFIRLVKSANLSVTEVEGREFEILIGLKPPP